MMLCKNGVEKLQYFYNLVQVKMLVLKLLFMSWEIYADVDTDAVLLIDAENAFNSIILKLMVHNLKFIYPHHCYLQNQLVCQSIKVIHCRWERDTFQWGDNSGLPNSYESICIRHSTINRISISVCQSKRNEC